MIRSIIAGLLITLTATAAFAASPFKIGFRAYSSATQVQCTVFGSAYTLPRDNNGTTVQGFAPSPAFSRSYTLGTKGFSSYSTNLGQRGVQFTCTTVGASTAQPVKLFLNGVETYFLTLSSGTIWINQ